MNELTHLDLFSGIGGFALAAKWNGYRTVAFCDNEPYAQAVLKKHWPDVPCHQDIREVRGELYAGVTLLTGGFPCQPFSVAGKQRGKTDDRYLWPEMLRVIREARPAWIIGENVAGIVNMALDQVHTDLEAEGYEVETIIIPACGVDAPHKRDRVWIIAKHLAHSGIEGQSWNQRKRETATEGMSGRHASKCSPQIIGDDVAHSEGEQSPPNHNRGKQGQTINTEQGEFGGSCGGSMRKFVWATEPRLGRVAYGIPNRSHRLKGLGNAIVPQVAAEIIRNINLVMENQ